MPVIGHVDVDAFEHELDPDGHAWWRTELDDLVDQWAADARVKVVIR